jgi:hypothetical protein
MRPRHLFLLSLVSGVPFLVFAGCSPEARLPVEATTAPVVGSNPVSNGDEEPVGSSSVDRMNQRLAEMGLNVRVAKAEFVTASSSGGAGQTILANDGREHSISMYVPSDARRSAAGNAIRYLVDLSDVPNGVSMTDAEAAIDRAMGTWNATGKVSIVKVADPGIDPDLADGLLGFGSVGTPHIGDIVHAGWMPPAFFDMLFPGGGNRILAVTFGFGFIPPTDIDGDKKFDASFSEIYYNNHFAWGINADPPIADVQTVALHESGHGLCLEHFGKIFVNTDVDGNPRLDDSGQMDVRFAPFAVMNAIIFGQHQSIEGSDNAQLSNLWANWPSAQ